MTLKNLFLARLYEDVKRKLWLVVIAILIFVIGIPIVMAMNISMIKDTAAEVGLVTMETHLYNSVTAAFKFNIGMGLWGSFFAVLAGMQGFSYLYDRSKIDFYHSKPIKASQQFLIIWLSGVLMYVIPFILGNVIRLLLVATSGVLDMELFGAFCEGMVISLGFYLCVYSTVILAVMLTGKPLITILGIIIFWFYEMAVRALYMSLGSFFFHFFYGYTGNNDWYMPWLSPLKILDCYYDNKIGLIFTMFLLILFAAVVLLIAYLCYKKRPSELAGSAMTFQKIKPFIKIGVAVPAALVAGVTTSDVMNYKPLDGTGSPFFPILLGILFLLLVCGLAQVIFESDIKGMFRKKRDIVISAVLTLAIVLIFRYDLFGFDNYIPKFDRIDSVSVITANNRYERFFIDENRKQIDKEEYTDKYMYLSGEDAQNVRELALLSIKQYQQYPNRKAFREGNNESSIVVYKFRLKNGRTVSREIPILIRDEQIKEIVARIEKSEDFIRYNEPAMSEYLLAVIQSDERITDVDISNGLSTWLMSDDKRIEELILCYRADLLHDSYEIRSSEIPIANIYITLYEHYGPQIRLAVYPSFENTVSFLKEKNYPLSRSSVASHVGTIMIDKYYPGSDETAVYTNADYVNMEFAAWNAKDCKSIKYTDLELNRKQQIINNAYPIDLIFEDWYQEYPYDMNYDIRISYKDGSVMAEEANGASLRFLKGKIPDFVEEDLR